MTVMPEGALSLDDPLLSTAKVAQMFDVKPETIRDWIAQGKIAGVKVNRSWKVRRSVVVAFAERRYGDGEPTTPADAPEAASADAGPCADDACPVLHDDPAAPVHAQPDGINACTDTTHPHPGGTCAVDA